MAKSFWENILIANCFQCVVGATSNDYKKCEFLYYFRYT
jgi:hypothetical protein